MGPADDNMIMKQSNERRRLEGGVHAHIMEMAASKKQAMADILLATSRRRTNRKPRV